MFEISEGATLIVGSYQLFNKMIFKKIEKQLIETK